MGFDRLGRFFDEHSRPSDMFLDARRGVREKTFATIAGLNILPPSSKTTGIYFTGTSSQKLAILTDVAIRVPFPQYWRTTRSALEPEPARF